MVFFDVWVLPPIALLALVGFVIYFAFHYAAEKAKHKAAYGGDYKRLADEAVNGQKALLSEIEKMNRTLAEIERVLKEV